MRETMKSFNKVVKIIKNKGKFNKIDKNREI